jgi:hypothetical protein
VKGILVACNGSGSRLLPGVTLAKVRLNESKPPDKSPCEDARAKGQKCS